MTTHVRLIAAVIALTAILSYSWRGIFPVNPAVAFAFLMASLTLLFMTIRETPIRLILGSICICGIGYLMAAVLLAIALGRPTRVSALTAATFLVFTVVGWLAFVAPSQHKWRYWLIHTILGVGIVSLAAKLIGWPYLGPGTPLTSFLFVLLGLGLRLVVIRSAVIRFEATS